MVLQQEVQKQENEKSVWEEGQDKDSVTDLAAEFVLMFDGLSLLYFCIRRELKRERQFKLVRL